MSRRRKTFVQVLVMSLAAVGVPILLGATTAAASSPRIAVGAAARLPHGARLGHALPAGRRLALTIALRPKSSAALTAFATAVSTPGNPQYGQYLTVSQFAQRFGATSSQIAAVARTLRAAGLSVGTATANHLSIPATGTAAQVQKAFSVTESQVTLPRGRVAFANDRAPLLSAGIAQAVQGVIGLDDLSVPRPQGLSTGHALRMGHARPHIPTGGAQPCASATSTATTKGAYTADFVATAYQFSPLYQAGNFGQGQTVAVFEQQPYDPADIGQYQGCYGTTATVTPVTVGVGPGADVPGATDDGEAALDIEQIIGLAPKASVLVYQGAPTSQGTVAIMNQLASDDKAKVISSSWGECESASGASVIGADDTALKEMAAQGQSFFISSGDSGSEMCSQLQTGDNSLSVITPGSDPFATGVGGSTLWDGVSSLYSGGTAVEGVWNDSSSTNGATGGGISTAFPMPAYQSTANAGLGVVDPHNSGAQCGSTTPCREVPDVSANADPVTGYVVFVTGQGGQSWTSIGGTSAAAPLWAAFTALVNDNAACRGQTIGFANPSLYQIAGSAYTSNFRDVATASPVSGDPSNDYTGTNSGEYPVKAGYDLATGLGSPLGSTLAGSLCALRSPVYSVSIASPGNQLTIRGKTVSLALHGADSGGAGLSYGASGLPAGLSINPSTGVISGTATTQQNATVTVSASDAFTNAGSTAFTWSVVVPGNPPLKAHSLSGLGKGKPKLTFTVASGSFAPALKSVQVKLPGGLSFAKKAKSLAKGITVKSGSRKVKFSAKVKGGALLITFKSAVTSATVTLASPTIAISRSEATKVRKHKVKKLTISLKATDASNKTTSLSVAFRKPK